MSRIIVSGGNKIGGKITLSGNKNAALKIVPASLIADSPTALTNVPVIRDVTVMLELAQSLGAKVDGIGTNTVVIDPTGLNSWELDQTLSSRIRASVVLAAPLLVRFGKAIIAPPGGDQIGKRLLETHFRMMENFGVKVNDVDGKYELRWEKVPEHVDIFLEEASVTATEMGLIMASGRKMSTTIDDAASEPHVRDLAEYLNKCGAKITGGGTNSIKIVGVSKLNGCKHKIISDHIEAGTFAIAAAITGGDLLIDDVVQKDYRMITSYLRDMGVKCKFEGSNKLRVLPSKLVSQRKEFQTRPWPGFPTDLMSPLIVLATQAEGATLCHDWMYEWRIFFVDDLISMGAKIFIADPHRVVVTGPNKLMARQLVCKDIRAGMSIILAALTANGTSQIDNFEMVERGYEDLQKRLSSLGADIKQI